MTVSRRFKQIESTFAAAIHCDDRWRIGVGPGDRLYRLEYFAGQTEPQNARRDRPRSRSVGRRPQWSIAMMPYALGLFSLKSNREHTVFNLYELTTRN
jgi:hypothetical protein